MYQVLIDGIDFTDRISKSINIEEYKTFHRDYLITNVYTFDVKNIDNLFTPNHPDSFFYGKDYLYMPVVIKNRNNDIIWDGIIQGVERNHDSCIASITTVPAIHKWREYPVVYTSADWETPAAAMSNIFIACGFTDYDTKSILSSSDILDTNSCYCKVTMTEIDGVKLLDCVDLLSEVACADAYSHNGLIYFKHWHPVYTGHIISIGEKNILSMKSVSDGEDNIINDYSIRYDTDGDVPAIDSAHGNIGALSRTRYGTKTGITLDTGRELITDDVPQIMFKDTTSAAYIGEQYIKRSHVDLETNPRPAQIVQMSVSIDYEQYINLDSFIRLTFSRENWTEKLFEVYRFGLDYDRNIINLILYEV